MHHDFDASEPDDVAAHKVVEDMYQGMITTFIVRPIASEPSDARALWNEICRIFDKKTPLPYSHATEPHLRYLAYNAGIARLSRQVADTAGNLWIELQQRLEAERKKSGRVNPVWISGEIQRYRSSTEKAVEAASDEYEKKLKPSINEIDNDINENRSRLAKGTRDFKTSDQVRPWERALKDYRPELRGFEVWGPL